MSRFKDILLEEPVQVLSRNLFDGDHQIMGVNRLEFVFVQKIFQCPEKRFVSDDGPQHVQNACAFGIGVAVEVVLRTVVSVENDRTHVARVRFPQVRILFAQECVRAFIFSQVMPCPEIVRIRAETLVHPGFGPCSQCDQIPPPLVGDLVGDDSLPGEILFSPSVMDDPLTENRRRSVLRAAPHPRRGDLGVLRPGVVISEQCIEKFDHLGGFLEDPFRILHILLVDPVGDRQRAEGIFNDCERADSQHEKIGGMWKFLRPVIGLRAGLPAFFDADQSAVGEHLVPVFDCNDHLICHLVVRVVITGKPVMRFIRPGDGRDHTRIGRALFVKKQAVVGICGVIFDCEYRSLAVIIGFR